MDLAVVAAGLQEAGIDARPVGGSAVVVDVDHRSDAVAGGTLFCCVRGSRVDGHTLAHEVVASGATALLVEEELDAGVPQLVVSDVRRAMGPAAAVVWGHPSRSLDVVGITGTNGKTTTVSMLRDVFAADGRPVEVIGTLTSRPDGPPTTPDGPELQRQLARWRDAGIGTVVMEVSSIALDVGRVDGTWFAAVGFTTLGVDHLDHHGTMEAYFAAKADLFRPERSARAAIRLDEEWGARLASITTIPVRGYRLVDAADVSVGAGATTFTWHGQEFSLRLPGDHNLANALCAATIAEWLDVPLPAIAAGLSVTAVAGRFETIEAGQDFTVAVDYAHTPDALAEVLAAARQLASARDGRVIVVFGCGGDRDPSKRPAMGEVASRLADLAVLTSDNPRSEDPAAIAADVLAGVNRPDAVHVELDRTEAIRHSARAARHGDVVLIAGKGHETTQTFADRVVDFDDRVVVAAALADLLAGDAG